MTNAWAACTLLLAASGGPTVPIFIAPVSLYRTGLPTAARSSVNLDLGVPV